jgi:transglutaminase superfamily protein
MASAVTPSSTTGRRTRCSTGVLERRRGLPILLSAVYVEVARRAGVPLAGVGLPGHYVVGHFGAPEPLLLDPFGGGVRITPDAPASLVRPWTPHETAMRMLNNLVPAFRRRGDLVGALRAAELRLALPAGARERDTCARSSPAFVPSSTERPVVASRSTGQPRSGPRHPDLRAVSRARRHDRPWCAGGGTGGKGSSGGALPGYAASSAGVSRRARSSAR